MLINFSQRIEVILSVHPLARKSVPVFRRSRTETYTLRWFSERADEAFFSFSALSSVKARQESRRREIQCGPP